MSLGNGIWKMESVDFAAMPFPADSKRVPGNGVRGVFQSNWRLTLCALSRIEAHRSNVCSVTCKLDFGTPFYLIRGVSATADDVTSLGAAGPESRGGIAFTTTHWSVVLEAQGESPQAQEALEKLCRTYWRPIYSFIRRQGSWTEDAEDLTQGFFALLLERKDLNTVRKEKGRLRSYLLASVKNFLADESRHAMAIKRGKGQRLIPLDDIRERDRIDIERSDRLTADQIYERRWAFTVLEQVMARLRDEYRSAGNVRFFDQMKKMLMDESGRPSQAQVASEFDMTENAVKQAFYRFRQRYQTLLREEIAHTVAMPGDIEDELRYLIAVVRA
jgi:RNA polymerase sigma factor (sigma-70 family)